MRRKIADTGMIIIKGEEMGRKNKKKKEEAVSYGAVALSGYIYQTLYAIVVSLKESGWD